MAMNRRRLLARSEAEKKAFDDWLSCQLQSMYGSVASEPLPADMVAMLEELQDLRHRADREPAKAALGRGG